MIRFRQLPWIVIFVFISFSCERELEYELRANKPQLVVNSVFGQDSLFRIEISTTAQPGQGNSILSLSDARIFLTEDGVALTDFSLDSSNALPSYLIGGGHPTERTLYFMGTQFSKVKAGRDYHISVSYPGYETAEATASIPRAARVAFHPERGTTDLVVEGKDLVEVRFTIQDDGLSHYYALELGKQKNGDVREPIDFYSFETVFIANLSQSGNVSGEGVWYDTREGLYFPNSQFQGTEKEFSIYVNRNHFNEKDNVTLRVISMSDDFYQFAVSYQQQRRNAGNPFAEPVQVHSNVQYGMGIFAGYSVTEVDLQ